MASPEPETSPPIRTLRYSLQDAGDRVDGVERHEALPPNVDVQVVGTKRVLLGPWQDMCTEEAGYVTRPALLKIVFDEPLLTWDPESHFKPTLFWLSMAGPEDIKTYVKVPLYDEEKDVDLWRWEPDPTDEKHLTWFLMFAGYKRPLRPGRYKLWCELYFQEAPSPPAVIPRNRHFYRLSSGIDAFSIGPDTIQGQGVDRDYVRIVQRRDQLPPHRDRSNPNPPTLDLALQDDREMARAFELFQRWGNSRKGTRYFLPYSTK